MHTGTFYKLTDNPLQGYRYFHQHTGEGKPTTQDYCNTVVEMKASEAKS